eukprot:CAMPEP_0118850182 /NCGR_PEP_ID=MMETSP1163-20130328/160_1 /TAXON_ID=124430 /ORGANISM="Phaeomonas parva, Strain CCMP2877" /LENGTH=40 /DNA_ID= /DNA_START= /DNA_END= /DNA_ORIENTATION=
MNRAVLALTLALCAAPGGVAWRRPAPLRMAAGTGGGLDRR